MDDIDAFTRLVTALRPWLSDVVIIGGWAHRLHPSAGGVAYAPILTRDADVALPLSNRIEGDIGAALRAANFLEEFSGEHTPPVSEYRLGNEDQGFYAEFLAHLNGGSVRRDGTANATVAVAGVTAQKLRFLDVLLVQPWLTTLDAASGFSLMEPLDVQVANPTSFIVQKLLIRSTRPPAKQAQDVLYIHDTIELFGSRLSELADIWKRFVKPALHRRAHAAIDSALREQFSSVNDVVREAARIPQDRSLTPERMRAVCEIGLADIFRES